MFPQPLQKVFEKLLAFCLRGCRCCLALGAGLGWNAKIGGTNGMCRHCRAGKQHQQANGMSPCHCREFAEHVVPTGLAEYPGYAWVADPDCPTMVNFALTPSPGSNPENRRPVRDVVVAGYRGRDEYERRRWPNAIGLDPCAGGLASEPAWNSSVRIVLDWRRPFRAVDGPKAHPF